MLLPSLGVGGWWWGHKEISERRGVQVTESPTCGECRYCVDTGVDISRYLHTHLTRARTGHWSPGMWALGGEVVRVRGGLLRDIALTHDMSQF